MRERMDMSHGLPSFAPEWGHPRRRMRDTLEVDVLVIVTGGCWDEIVPHSGEHMPSWTRTHRDFLGFRLVRSS